MAVTASQIKTEFPEFNPTSDALLSAKIADAEALVSTLNWGNKRDQAVKYMACHLVALSPRGEPARLRPDREPSGATTLYERRYNELKRSLFRTRVV